MDYQDFDNNDIADRWSLDRKEEPKRGLQWRDALCVFAATLITLTVVAVFC